jgi:hypothetical protein
VIAQSTVTRRSVQERARRLGLAEPAADEHLREHVGDSEVAGQAACGGELVRLEPETGVLMHHGRA